jgi:glycerophosphoryl diester phosphodiesterase
MLGLILALAMTYVILAIYARPIPDHPFFNQEGVLVIAHRGGSNLWPENTLYAFENAVELGVDVLEMDVRSTKDGVIVVIHDATVDRTTNGTGLVQECSFAELQTLDAGYKWTADNGNTYPYRNRGITVPRLEDVFTAFPNVLMNIEIKQSQSSVVQPLVKMIRDHGMTERVLIASFDMDTLREFRRACPEVATTAGKDEVRLLYKLSRVFLDGVYTPKAEAIQVPEYWGDVHVLTGRFIASSEGRNMDVHVWTVNDVDDMQRTLDLGVGGIITDNPDQLLTLLGRNNLSPSVRHPLSTSDEESRQESVSPSSPLTLDPNRD